MKEQEYVDDRTIDQFLKYHEWTRTHRPQWPYEIVRSLMTTIFLLPNRVKAIDEEHVPGSGAVIFVANHFSFLDHFYIGMGLRRKLQFMAKSQLFQGGLLTFIFQHGGVFPVMRGKGDDQAFPTAKSILARGGVVQVYAEGGRSRRLRPARAAKRGPGKLALESGEPVLPIAIYGSQFMRYAKRGRLPKVIVRYGKPIQFEKIAEPTKEQQLAAAQIIFDRVLELWDGLEAEFATPRQIAEADAADERADAAEAERRAAVKSQ
jgi:1-acyl-sn-glycerol-3-phosphate acyltransferase